MRTFTAAVLLSITAAATYGQGQAPDPAKWMCRNTSESGGFVYQGETVFGSQACRPIPTAATTATPSNGAPAPSDAPVSTANTQVQPTVGTAAAQAPVAPQATQTQSQTPAVGFVLEDGTAVHLILSENLSSADAQTGQTVEFEVVDDVIVDGFVVIPRGAIAWATVTDAEHKRRMGRAGKLDLNIDKVRLADGERGLLRAVKDVKGGGHTGAMVGAMVATSLIVWPAAPLFLLMHGKDVTIPKGTAVSAFTQGSMTLDQSKFQKQLAVAQ